MQSIDVARVETVGLDLGKRWFHVHGVDGQGETCVSRRLPRFQVAAFFAALPRCRVAMETCGGAHHWGRLLTSMGHDVKLIPAQFVRPYVKSNKYDAADAEAICEAAQRPGIRFAALKDLDVQAMLALHRSRRLLIKQRPQTINSLRGQCAEFGVVAPQNRAGVTQLIDFVQDPDDERLPALARTALAVLVAMLETLQARIAELDRKLLQWHRGSPESRRLGAIPGVGPLTATALTAALGDGRHFRSGRQFAASLGLVPRQFGTGGTLRLGRISKRGDGYLRRNLVHGARAALLLAPAQGRPRSTAAAGAGRRQVHERGRRGGRQSQCAHRLGDGASRPALPTRRSDDGGLIRAPVTVHRTRLQENMMAQLDTPGTGQPRIRFWGAEPARQIGNRFAELHQGQRSAIIRSHRQAAYKTASPCAPHASRPGSCGGGGIHTRMYLSHRPKTHAIR